MDKQAASGQRRFRRWMLFFIFWVLAAVVAGLWFGATPLDWSLLSQPGPERDIFFYSRLPRVLLGLVVGFALSSGGVAFQSLLRNPLADPYILGVSGGAALGSVLAIVLRLPFAWASVAAFGCALLSLLVIYNIAQVRGRLPVHGLLLTGVIYNAFTFALIMFVHAFTSFEQSHRIWFLMVGSLEAESYSKLLVVALLVLVGFGILWWQSGKMNLIALGEESAEYLGLEVHRFRKLLFFAASLMIGATVSVAGLIGFVGLFIPHLVRLVLGADHRVLLPGAALFGAGFLVFADLGARCLLSGSAYQTQIPVGVITALLGGPCFVYLLKRPSSRGRW